METVVVFVVKSSNNGCTSGKVTVHGDDAFSSNPSLAVFMLFFCVVISLTLRFLNDLQRMHNLYTMTVTHNLATTAPDPIDYIIKVKEANLLRSLSN